MRNDFIDTLCEIKSKLRGVYMRDRESILKGRVAEEKTHL